MQDSDQDFKQDFGRKPTTFKRRLAYLIITLTNLGILVGLLIVIDQSPEELAFLNFLAPYKKYLSLVVVAVFGWSAIASGSRWVHSMAVRWASADAATAVRILFRVGAIGVLLSVIVSTLTTSTTAAITMGSFTGLVVGFATQTVLGNAVAGLFLGIMRPIGIGDNITVSGNSGVVVAITLMHTVLRTVGQDILVPSSNVAHGVIVRQR